MKANEFVKKFGWEKAERVVELATGESWADHYDIKEGSIGTAGALYSKRLCEHNDNFVCLHDLKRLVESWELVEPYGGLGEAKEYLYAVAVSGGSFFEILHNAIADVESCQ